MNALLADDDEFTRVLITAALTKLGHTVHTAANGREAWDAWKSGDFLFVVSDWMMPDLDGLELCRRIRAEQGANYTYIALLTSRSGKPDYMEAMTAGADDFITKPVEKNAFAARVRVAERVLALHANLRAAHTDVERRVCERTAELETRLRAAFGLLACLEETQINHVIDESRLQSLREEAASPVFEETVAILP